MKNKIHSATSISIIISSIILTACGGGGGASTASSATTVAAPVTYTSAAAIGERLNYTVDISKLTYSYTITDSQYGLAGNTGSGTLVHNSDGTYTPSGVSNARIAVLPNGLLLGAFRASINGTMTTIPVIGISNPVTTFSAAAATYNYVSHYHIGSTYTSNFGTFQITSSGTWTDCAGGNLTATCSGVSNSGTLNSLGGGEFQVLSGSSVIGTAIVQNSNGQNVVVVDLNNSTTGIGLLVGSTQQVATTAQTDGNWYTISSTGVYSTFTTTGGNLTYSSVNGLPYTGADTFIANSPWTGFATPGTGGEALLAGTGVFADIKSDGTAVIGLKLN